MAEADPKNKDLVIEASKIPRETSIIRGFLRKKNSSDKWQKRYFEVLLSANNGSAYFVYYKDAEKSSPMLCAMDLARSSLPALVVTSVAGKELTGSSNEADFAITWDKYRTFRAGNRTEAEKWVEAIKTAQTANSARKSPLVDPQTAALAVDAKKSGALKNYGSSNGNSESGTPEWGKKDTQSRGAIGAAFGGSSSSSDSSNNKSTSSSCCVIS
jgi:hypothetical protein